MTTLVLLCMLAAPVHAEEELAPPSATTIHYDKPDEVMVARDREAAAAQLVRYSHRAATVMIGTVLSTRIESGHEIPTLQVEQTLRGTPGPIIDFHVPPPIATDDPVMINPKIIVGYRVMVFIDDFGKLIEGNSVYLVEAGHIWRNKRDGVFLQPRADRDWVKDIDPERDYSVFSIEEVQKMLTENPRQ